MKNLHTFLIFILTTYAIQAQVSGNIYDQDGDPVPFIQIVLLHQADSGLVKGTISDEKGTFLIDQVKAGNYFLHIKSINYQLWYSFPFTLTSEQVFPRIILNEKAVELDAVEIQAEKHLFEQTREGIVINVQSSMLSKGSTALQIMERTPGIVIDQQNQKFTLNGQSGAIIMINGKRMRMSSSELVSFLNGISGDNIEKVELLTSPSARHDAEGTAGIINIITKKNEELGTNGSFSLTAGYGWAEKATASGNLNHRTKSTNYYGSYSFNRDNSFWDWHVIGFSSVPTAGGDVITDFNSNTNQINQSHNLMAGMEKEVNDQLVVGGNLTLNHTHTLSFIDNRGLYDYANGSFLLADIAIDGDAKWDNLTSSFFLEKTFDQEGKLSVDANYLYYHNLAPTIVSSTYFDRLGEQIFPGNEAFASANRGSSETGIQVGVLNVGYQTKLHPKLSLETGAKGVFSFTGNTGTLERRLDGEWIKDERNVTNFQIRELIGAAYASFQWQMDSSTQLTAGTRYEFWDRQFGDSTLNRRFGRFFPSVFLSHNLSLTSSIVLSYTQRITRPDYVDLASYRVYNDPVSVMSGNPFLQPTISNQLKASYQFQGKNIALVYMHEINPIVRYQIVENEQKDLFIVAPQNLDYQRSLAIQASIPWQITPWWSFNIGGSVGVRRYRLSYTQKPFIHTYMAYDLNGSQTFSFGKGFSAEISGWYVSSHRDGSKMVDGFGALNGGIKKDLGKNRGSFQLTVTDIFKSINIYSRIGYLTKEAFGAKSEVVFQPESTNNR
ncbi:MAG: TonB-dependent receptor, partial [Bacteroidetes bacterium]|nr:TonB-dependent receptor [Bacteroidota bacterium]